MMYKCMSELFVRPARMPSGFEMGPCICSGHSLYSGRYFQHQRHYPTSHRVLFASYSGRT